MHCSSLAALRLQTSSMRNAESDDFASHWQLGARIGDGSFSTVFSARGATGASTATRAAVKLVASEPHRLRQELRVLQDIGPHRHIITPAGFFEGGRRAALVLELVPAGDLQTLLQAEGAMPEPMACACVAQLREALCHIHNAGFVHRDVKLDNVLCMETLSYGTATTHHDHHAPPEASPHAPPTPHIKLCDFGHSMAIDALPVERKLFSGTPGYAAPEVALQTSFRDRAWSTAADAWGVGVVLYALLSNELPFDTDVLHAHGPCASLDVYATPPRSPCASPATCALLRSLLSVERTTRGSLMDTSLPIWRDWLKDWRPPSPPVVGSPHDGPRVSPEVVGDGVDQHAPSPHPTGHDDSARLLPECGTPRSASALATPDMNQAMVPSSAMEVTETEVMETEVMERVDAKEPCKEGLPTTTPRTAHAPRVPRTAASRTAASRATASSNMPSYTGGGGGGGYSPIWSSQYFRSSYRSCAA